MYKYRLLKFGCELVENLRTKYGTKVEIIKQTEKMEGRELAEGLVQIVNMNNSFGKARIDRGSDRNRFENINKTKKVRRLRKKLKRKQRQISQK